MKSALPLVGTSRREVLKQAAGLAGAAMIGSSTARAAQADTGQDQARKRALRLAHTTDIHVKPELRANEGLTACLHHMQEHHRPDLILNTGDTIFDAMAADQDRVRSLWKLSAKTWKDACSIPVEHAIGNHDIWGINKKGSKTDGTEPLYGKKWVMSLFEWERPYRSFDRAGWHFIAIDSVFPQEGKYIGHVDDQQFAWLEQDLAQLAPTTPALIFCHIPILSAAAFFKAQSEKSGDWAVPAAIMSIDARRFKNLFVKYPNVKLCLSGHLHLYDRVDYLGVSYVCGGAVSGGWWKGKNQEHEPGYGIIDLYTDGSFENQYVSYGWQPQT